MSQCLWKVGGDLEWEGRRWSTLTVAEAEIESKLSEGWHMTHVEALAAAEAEKPAEVAVPAEAAASEPEPVSEGEPSDRELLEAEATRLGIQFDGRTSDRKLAEKIEAAKG